MEVNKDGFEENKLVFKEWPFSAPASTSSIHKKYLAPALWRIIGAETDKCFEAFLVGVQPWHIIAKGNENIFK